jgi:hypothetical protein
MLAEREGKGRGRRESHAGNMCGRNSDMVAEIRRDRTKGDHLRTANDLFLEAVIVGALKGCCEAIPSAVVSKDVRVGHHDGVLELLEEKVLVNRLLGEGRERGTVS